MSRTAQPILRAVRRLPIDERCTIEMVVDAAGEGVTTERSYRSAVRTILNDPATGTHAAIWLRLMLDVAVGLVANDMLGDGADLGHLHLLRSSKF